MPYFSQRSRSRLYTCEPILIQLFTTVVNYFDCTILCGHRNEEEQDEAFRTEASQTPWPESMHNHKPSKAIDVTPYPVNFNDIRRHYYFAGFVKGIAQMKSYKIRWGGDWDKDTEVKDNKFNDLVHFELAE